MLDYSCPRHHLGNGSRGAATENSAGRKPRGKAIKLNPSPGGATGINASTALNAVAEQSVAPPGLGLYFRVGFLGLAPQAI